MNFALVGAAGFVAPRHLQAIHETGNNLIAALDPHDSVGILDKYFPEAQFFTEVERFDRFLEMQRRQSGDKAIEYVSICSPNYLHDAHVRLAMRVKAHAICEKPMVINPWNLDQLAELEQEHQRRVFTILQLRLHPAMKALKQRIDEEANPTHHDVCLTYITRRGAWYNSSWKGSGKKSGGLVMNIGIHFFDLLLWLFGPVTKQVVHLASSDKMAGLVELEKARVRWFLSIDAEDLPQDVKKADGHAHRSITLDGEEVEMSGHFTDLHTESYREVLAGRGFGIEDARASVELVYQVRNSREVSARGDLAHPLLKPRGVE